MKKRLLAIFTAVLILVMAIPMAVPAMAHVMPADSDSNILILAISRPNLHYHDGDTIEYTVTVSVPLAGIGFGNPADQEDIDTTFLRPDGVLINLPHIDYLTRGDIVTFTSANDTGLSYIINHADENGGGLVTAFAQAISAIAHTNELDTDHAEASRDISTQVSHPSTAVSISSSAATVVSGGSVDLTVTETNDSAPAENLTDVSVVVNDGSSDIATLVAPPDSGDLDADGVLDPGETWSWTITTGALSATTTFTATGSAQDIDGDVITFPDDPDEQDAVTVEVINPTTITTITSSAASVVSGGSVDLTVTEENDGDAELTDPQVVVNDGTTDIATLVAPPDSGDLDADGVLDPGEVWSWTITTGALSATTTFTATGSGVDPLGNVVTFPDDPDEQDAVTVEVINPTTITTITASAATVSSGDTVDLTVTEENDGDAELTDPQVVVNDGTTDIATLVAPPDSGDLDADGVLDPGEVWSWTITTGALSATTTFTATGSGVDPLGNVVTFPDDADEQDAVTVEVVGREGLTPGFWKNNAEKWGAVAWVGYSPDDSFNAVFGCGPEITLLEALNLKGGQENALIRQAVAALLNASNPYIDYPATEAEIIQWTCDALDSGDMDTIENLKDQFDTWNNLGGGVDQHGNPI